MEAAFHLSLGVNSIDEEVKFFTSVLGARVTHSEPKYTNLNVFGAQITLKNVSDIKADLPEFHFGFNLSLDQFSELASSLVKSNSMQLVTRPAVIDAGTLFERKKMYLKTPSGYLVELKGYK